MMDMTIIRKKAKKLGVKTSKTKKDDVIKAIQKAEGNFDCFGSAEEHCDQESCTWRKGCMR